MALPTAMTAFHGIQIAGELNVIGRFGQTQQLQRSFAPLAVRRIRRVDLALLLRT
jgi:hypothetical protein